MPNVTKLASVPPDLPAPSPVLFIIGAALVAWFSLLSESKRRHICRVFDVLLGSPDESVVMFRAPKEQSDARQQLRLAGNWWRYFRPIVLSEARKFAVD